MDRFTTAPRGEVDGVVLDDGTWLHWPPHMEDRFKDILKEGDRVSATGRTETGPAGDTHFEIQSLTNLRTNAKGREPRLRQWPAASASRTWCGSAPCCRPRAASAGPGGPD